MRYGSQCFHRAGRNDHAFRLERAAGNRSTDIAHVMHYIGQQADLFTAHLEFLMQIQRTGFR